MDIVLKIIGNPAVRDLLIEILTSVLIPVIIAIAKRHISEKTWLEIEHWAGRCVEAVEQMKDNGTIKPENALETAYDLLCARWPWLKRYKQVAMAAIEQAVRTMNERDPRMISKMINKSIASEAKSSTISGTK